MALVNSKLLPSMSAASSCEKALRDVGFQQVYLTGSKTGETLSDDDAMRSMMTAYVPKANAKIYAEAIRKGAALVTVHSAFGTTKQALDIIGRFNPVASSADVQPEPMREWDERTPASSALQFPPLTKTTRPFEAVWNVKSLTKTPRLYGTCLGLKSLSANKTMMTGKLSSNPTPLSSKLGLPCLSKRQAPVTLK